MVPIHAVLSHAHPREHGGRADEEKHGPVPVDVVIKPIANPVIRQRGPHVPVEPGQQGRYAPALGEELQGEGAHAFEVIDIPDRSKSLDQVGRLAKQRIVGEDDALVARLAEALRHGGQVFIQPKMVPIHAVLSHAHPREHGGVCRCGPYPVGHRTVEHDRLVRP